MFLATIVPLMGACGGFYAARNGTCGRRHTQAAVGLDFAAAATVALIDGSNVLGVFATNGATRSAWVVLALVLLVLAVVGPRESG
jgi:hypothetical protein